MTAMHVEPQGPQECMLATLAALSGRPLAEVRERALARLRTEPGLGHVTEWCDLFTWRPVQVRRRLFWTTISSVARDLGGDALFDLVDQGCVMTPGTERLSKRLRNLPEGRGTVLVKCGRLSHIMPFEDGFLYNPGDPRPQTLRDYRRAHPGWSVLEIRRMNTGEK